MDMEQLAVDDSGAPLGMWKGLPSTPSSLSTSSALEPTQEGGQGKVEKAPEASGKAPLPPQVETHPMSSRSGRAWSCDGRLAVTSASSEWPAPSVTHSVPILDALLVELGPLVPLSGTVRGVPGAPVGSIWEDPITPLEAAQLHTRIGMQVNELRHRLSQCLDQRHLKEEE